MSLPGQSANEIKY